ncbi:hypothetical protein POJ06DRAFT_181624, partial [Lipomyces tetrasporus]
VLLTGATGFIAVHVLKLLLSKGYTVRATVRSAGKSAFLRDKFATTKLSFAIVPDIALPGAFDDAVKDMDYVVHTASPFKSVVNDNLQDLLIPAVNGTKGVLESVQKYAPTVKQVVVTSSFAAVFNGPLSFRGLNARSESDWNNITWEQALEADNRVAYRASKKFAESAVWDFVKEQNPNFSVTVLNPPLVWGPMEHEVSLATLNTSNSYIYNLLQDPVNPDPSLIFAFVDVRDLAEAHVAAIGNPKASNQRIIVSGGYYTYAAMIGILQK